MKRFMITISSVLVGILVLLLIINIFGKSEKDKLEAKMDSNETFLLVMGTTTCSACSYYKENTLDEYVKTDQELELVFIYSDKVFSSEGKLKSFLRKYNMTYQYSPSTYIIKNGKVVAMVDEVLTLDGLQEFIADNT